MLEREWGKNMRSRQWLISTSLTSDEYFVFLLSFLYIIRFRTYVHAQRLYVPTKLQIINTYNEIDSYIEFIICDVLCDLTKASSCQVKKAQIMLRWCTQPQTHSCGVTAVKWLTLGSEIVVIYWLLKRVIKAMPLTGNLSVPTNSLSIKP